MLFKEDKIAEIEIKKIQLEAMEKRMKEIRPLHDLLSVEINIMRDDIKRDEEKLSKEE